MGSLYHLSDYRPDPAALEAAMRRHPSSRRNVTLTPKGERWMLNLMGYGTAAAFITLMLALWGLAGWIEGL